jgi:hypothetical protein
MTYTLKPDAQGFLIINPGIYKPGDTIFLSGNFKAVAVYKLVGSAEAPIKITNAPNEVTTIGDINWSGGAWPHGLALRGCRYIEVCGSSRDNFLIIGSNSAAKDSNGYSVRAAYWNLMIMELSDNFKVHDITIKYGGTAIICKTDVVKTDPKTWFPNTYLVNFEFYNITIDGCMNEGIYLGHTATYWNINNSQPVYSGTINTEYMKQPVKLRNVSIHHNKLVNVGNDGIQTAAIDNLKVYDNEISNWAVNKDSSHNGGILIGGRVVNFEVYNNTVKNGYGEFLQIYAEVGTAIVKNNLLVNNQLSGIGLRGGKGLAVAFINNTIVNSGHDAFRVNGSTGGTGKNILSKNIIVQPAGRYIYLENGGVVAEEDNKKAITTAAAAISSTTFVPIAGSASVGYGYNTGTVVEPPAETKLSVSITLPTITLPEGTHILKLTMPDGKVSDIKIVVAREQ